jgi:uncharacterized protein (TIGR02391 family)
MPLSDSWPDEATARAIGREALGIAMLYELRNQPEERWNRTNFTSYVVEDSNYGWRPAGRQLGPTQIYTPGKGRQERQDLKALVGDAWDWLVKEGYLTADPSQATSTWVVLTQKGGKLLEQPRSKAIAFARAVTSLNHDLHPRLEQVGVGNVFRRGDLDHALRDAFRDVEHVARELSGLNIASPVLLFEQAFAPPAGPLCDATQSRSEQLARQRFFMGAFGQYRNAPNHTYVSFDPAEAIEVVLLASLLMRLLDRIAASLGRTLDQISGPP